LLHHIVAPLCCTTLLHHIVAPHCCTTLLSKTQKMDPLLERRLLEMRWAQWITRTFLGVGFCRGFNAPGSNKKIISVMDVTLLSENFRAYSPSEFGWHVLASLALAIVREWILFEPRRVVAMTNQTLRSGCVEIQQKNSIIVGGGLTPKKLSTKLSWKKNRFGHLLGFKNVQKAFHARIVLEMHFFQRGLTKVR